MEDKNFPLWLRVIDSPPALPRSGVRRAPSPPRDRGPGPRDQRGKGDVEGGDSEWTFIRLWSISSVRPATASRSPSCPTTCPGGASVGRKSRRRTFGCVCVCRVTRGSDIETSQNLSDPVKVRLRVLHRQVLSQENQSSLSVPLRDIPFRPVLHPI